MGAQGQTPDPVLTREAVEAMLARTNAEHRIEMAKMVAQAKKEAGEEARKAVRAEREDIVLSDKIKIIVPEAKSREFLAPENIRPDGELYMVMREPGASCTMGIIPEHWSYHPTGTAQASSERIRPIRLEFQVPQHGMGTEQIGRASCRERV